MLSKKRPILFEVMGRRGRAMRAQAARETPVPRTRETPVPRTRETPVRRARETPVPRIRKKAEPRVRVRERAQLLMASPMTRWAALGMVLVTAVTFAIWRLQRPSPAQPPLLHASAPDGERGVEEAGGGAGRASGHSFAICAIEKPYKTPAERRLAAEKVQEIVDFLGYHPDPGFRDVRGQDCPGKESGTGAFRIYVGSAERRPELVPLKDRLMALVWKKTRPFQNASIRMVER
jgi:hypothetical protein